MQNKVIRGCFDIGSGTTKLMIVSYDKSSKKIIRNHFQILEEVLFGQNWKIHGDLSDDIIQQGMGVIGKFINICKEHEVQELCGIATEVFRKANKGEKYLQQINDTFGLKVHLIEQKMEAELGFLTAVSVFEKQNIISWDSGGASFQITTKENNNYLQYNGALGSSISFNLLYEKVRKEPLKMNTSANPVSLTQLQNLKEIIKSHLQPKPDFLEQNKKQIIGIGDEFCLFKLVFFVADKFDLKMENRNHQVFSLLDAQKCLEILADKKDEQLCGIPQYFYAVPKLCLLVSVMEHLEINQVNYAPSMGSCPAMLGIDHFWV